jgi:hypothetical protein
VTGVGFFDFIHGQTGVAPNGIELHPILNIAFTANTMTTIASSGTPSKWGEPVAITATVTNEDTAPVPTGNVTLFDGAASVATVALDQNGQAAFGALLPSVGTHSYTASYEGDSAAAPSTSAPLAQVVTKADQTITFAAIAAKIYGAPDFTLDATASSGFPVTFSVVSGPATVFGNSVHITGVGTVTINASQDGDANHNAAPGVDRSFDVAKATPLFSDLRSATVDDNPPVSTVLSGRIGLLAVVPTGSVSITVNGGTQSAPINADGTFAATFGPMPAAAQPYAIVYAYAGDGNFNAAANGSGTLTVRDRTAPTIAAHPNVIAEATSAAGAAVSYVAPATSDNLDPAGVAICVPAPGSQFSMGSTIVNCNATDTNGNAAAATSFTVTVADSTPPARPALVVDHGILWPPDNKFVPVTITARTTDAVTASPACTITGITKNDDDGAFTITGPLTADLLAAKIQDADELVYRLTVSCTDGAGNTSQPAAINVIVPHDQGKGEHH